MHSHPTPLPFPRPLKPARIRRQKQTYQNDLAFMGFLIDEPLHHTRHSAAVRYLDAKDIMAEHRAGLAELPFAVGVGSRRWKDSDSASSDAERDTEIEMVKPANNEIIESGSRDVPVKKKSNRIPYIQTPEESRKMRRVRDRQGREREKFERLIGGGLLGDLNR